MYCRYLIVIVFITVSTTFSQRFESFRQLSFGNNLSTELFIGSSPYVNKTLPDLDMNVSYTWIEPTFQKSHWLLKESHLRFGIDYTQSPWFSRLGTDLGIKISEFFEFQIGYSSLFYLQSSIQLAPSENSIQKWNSELVRESLYQRDAFDNLQAVNSKARFTLDYTEWLFVAEIEHLLIDINTSNNGYNYDFYYGIPVYERDQVVTLIIDFRYNILHSPFDLFISNRYVSKGFKNGLWKRYADTGLNKNSYRIGSIYHIGSRQSCNRFIFGLDVVYKNSEYLNDQNHLVRKEVTEKDKFYIYLSYQNDLPFLN